MNNPRRKLEITDRSKEKCFAKCITSIGPLIAITNSILHRSGYLSNLNISPTRTFSDGSKSFR